MKVRGLLLFVALAAGPGFVQAQSIERVEPPFWWAGMKNTSLQLLIYGDQISEFMPELTYPGVTVRQAVRVPNPDFLVVDLAISATAEPGVLELHFAGDAGMRLSYDYELRERTPGSAARRGFDSSDLIYLITPDRFANGDPDNDRVEGMREAPDRSLPDGRHGGDLQGIIDHVDYLDEMGFTQVWISPVLENDQPKYSYHGYAITDHYKVDPRFGSNALYLELSARLRERGMGLIIDQVMNHIGNEHWWFKDIPSADWVNRYDQPLLFTNHARNTIQDPYASRVDSQLFVDGWFDRHMPDLNQRNAVLAQYLIQNTIWWIEYADLRGVRMDTYSYPDMEFMAEWTRRIAGEYPNFSIVGEEWSNNPAIVSYWQRGKVNPNGYRSDMSSLFDFPLQEAIWSGLKEAETWGTGLKKIFDVLGNDFLYPQPNSLVVMLDNHDMDRVLTALNDDQDLLRMALAMLLTTRGVPQIYYGTEVLLTNPGAHNNHGVIRTDFPGGWAGDEVNAFSGRGLSAAQRDMRAYIRKLANWRKEKTVIHDGRLMHYSPAPGTAIEGVYVYFRYDDKDKVMVAINKNADERKLPVNYFREMLQPGDRLRDVISGARQRLGTSIALPARSASIFEVN